MSSQLDSSSKIFGYLLKNVTNTIVYCCSRCDAVFDMSSQLEDHINIHDSGNGKEKELNDLPNECFDVIFQFLPLNDLATTSETCTRYKELAECYFNRKHQDEKIDIESDTAEFLFHGRKYLCRFRSLIRNLELSFYDSRTITDTFLTTKQNCAKRLKSLLLYTFNDDCHISEVHIEIIAEQIETLEVLALHDVLCVDFIVEKCQSIKKLAIDYQGLRIDPSRTFWMNKHFPHLTTFILQNLNEPNIDLTRFLRLNPQLEVVLSDDLSAIKSICLSKNFLSYAAMKFVFEEELLEQLDNIKLCCKNKFIKSLDLLLSWDDVPNLQTLQLLVNAVQHVGGLHFKVGQENISFFETVGSQPNVKRLCLRINTQVTKNDAEKIAKCFPNISELRIFLEETVTIEFKDIMLPFISRISTLNVIYFRYFGGKIECSNDDMVQLDCIRRKLNDVVNVKVYVCKDDFKNFIRPTGTSLKYFEVLANFECNFCTIEWIYLDFISSLDKMK